MWWRKRQVVTFKPIQIEGDPVGEFTLEHWKALAGMYKAVPGLEAIHKAAFTDAMTELRKCLVGDKSHLELVRVGQKLSDLWEALSMPRTAVAEANKILSSMQTEQTEEPDRSGPRNVM